MKIPKSLLTFFLISGLTITSQAQIDVEWVTTTGGSLADKGMMLATDNNGNVITVGSFHHEIDFDPGVDTFLLNAGSQPNIFAQKLDANGNFIWAFQLGGINSDAPSSVNVDSENNIYVTGAFYGNIDFDPGPNEYYLNSNDGNSFVMKLDENMNLIWAKNLGVTFSSSTIDANGNIFIIGNFYVTQDFDPGPGIYNLSTNTTNDVDFFILKLDTDGNFEWAKSIGGPDGENAESIVLDSNNDLVLCGTFESTVDFDQDTGIVELTATDYNDVFLLKLSYDGDFIWVRAIHGASHEKARKAIVDSDDNIYFLGEYLISADFDPTEGVYTLLTNQSTEFLTKYSTDGDFLWVKTIGSYGDRIAIDDEDNLFWGGVFDSDEDADPGLGILSYPNKGIYISKLNSSGSLLWSATFNNAGSGYGPLYDIQIRNNSVHLTGTFQGTIDFLPGLGTNEITSNGSYDIYTIKLGQDDCSNFALEIDSVYDLNCSETGLATGHAYGGLTPYAYSWASDSIVNDSTAIFMGSGIYTLYATDAMGCLNQRSVLQGGPTSIQTHDLNVNLAISEMRQMTTVNIWLDVFNQACIPVSGDVKLVLDSTLDYVGATPSPDNIFGDTLIWNFTDLTYDSVHLSPVISAIAPELNSLFDTVTLEVIAEPLLSDFDTSNNHKTYRYRVLGSYDPNDKQVYPQGVCIPHYVERDQPLTYTVRFQNTGNAEAIDIFIMDTLDYGLDINTLRVVGNSHPVITEIYDDHIIKFRFDDIYLPDSTSNEPMSHGYVMYEISHRQGVADGTEIDNTAHIYFDFNEPIVTNTVLNTIITEIPDISNAEISQSGYTLTANIASAQYQWLDCNNSHAEIPGANSQLYTPIENGDYAVRITSGGCESISECFNVIWVGLDERDGQVFDVFPNPTTKNITINIPAEALGNDYSISNTIGAIVMRGQLKEQTSTLDMGTLAEGVYVFHFMGKTLKLVKVGK